MLIHFVISIVLIAVIDFVWLGLVATQFYVNRIGDLGRIVDGSFQPLYLPAILVYIALAAGVTYFAVNNTSSALPIFVRGALLGLIIYGTYDMTNMATLKSWPWSLALVDMAWGSFLCGTTAYLTQWISTRFIG